MFQDSGVFIGILAQSVFIICLMLLSTIAIKIIAKRARIQSRAKPVFTLLIQAVTLPLIVACNVAGILTILDLLAEKFAPENLKGLTDHITTLATGAVLLWALVRIIARVVDYFHNFNKEKNKPSGTVFFLGNIAKIAAALTVTLCTFSGLGFNLDGFLAIGGLSGVIAGWASKDLLANIAGYFVINIDNLFQVGDDIVTTNVEGTVQKIGLRFTVISTADEKSPSYIPNSIFSSAPIRNLSRRAGRPLKEKLKINYRNDIPGLQDLINKCEEVISALPYIANDSAPYVSIGGLTSHTCDLTMNAFIHARLSIDYEHLKADLLLKVAQAIHNNNYKIVTLAHELIRVQDE